MDFFIFTTVKDGILPKKESYNKKELTLIVNSFNQNLSLNIHLLH